MQRIKIAGNRLERGAGIVAASSVVNQESLAQSLPRFAEWGMTAAVAEQVRFAKRYLAGPDEARASALDAFAREPQLGTIWCARGGYGATRLLPLLDQLRTAEALRRDPKLLVGYSDVTGLHLYFYAKLGIPSLHAIMPGTPRFSKIPPRMDRLLRAILAGKMGTGRHSPSLAWNTRPFCGPRREAEGVLLGGNLSLVATMVGTPWMPSLAGKLLFLEDCGERPYRVDRMLTQLANAGALRGLRGVLLGDFEADVEYKEKGERRYWRDVFLEKLEPLGVPVIDRVPVGHGKQNEPLPLGVRARITKAGKLEFLEQPVKA